MNMRIGHGYDVHKLVGGRDLILGGVNIPHHLGLLGHSDADCTNCVRYFVYDFTHLGLLSESN